VEFGEPSYGSSEIRGEVGTPGTGFLLNVNLEGGRGMDGGRGGTGRPM